MSLLSGGRMPRFISTDFRRRGPLVFVLLALAVAASAHAQSLTLSEAVRRASAQAPRLEARDAAIDAAREDAARAGRMPDPMLVFGIDNLPVTGADAFDTAADDMTMKRIGLRQEVPAPAKRAALRALASRRVELVQVEAVAERLQVQQAVAEAWIDAWSARQQLQAVTALREQAAMAATLAKARSKGGGGLDEALAAQAAVLEIDNRLEELRADAAAAVARLVRWLPGVTDADLAGAPDFATLPLDRNELRARIDSLGPLLGAGARVESAAASVDVARAEKRPDWSLMASYGQRERERSDMLMLEVGVSLPLFGRNRQDRDVLARQAEYRQAVAMQEDERRAMLAEVDAAFARWQALQRQVALHEERLLPLAHDRSTVALAAYRAGGPLQPWLDARAAELEVHRAHAEHLGELGRTWATLAFLLPENTP
jgi:outer membrane protein TolC